MLKHTIMFAVVAGFLFALAPADAGIYQWDAVAGGDSVVQDGAGTWEVDLGNWYDQTTPGNDVTWVDGNDAVFGGGAGGAAGTVTVSGTVAANVLTFNQPFAGNYTLSGGTINLGTGGITDNNTTGTTTVSSNVTWSTQTVVNTTTAATNLILNGGGGSEAIDENVGRGLDKRGPGTLTLSGASPFTFGDGKHRGPEGWHVETGKLVIEANVSSRNGDFGSLRQGAELEIKGNGSFTVGGGSQGFSGTTTLRDNAQLNLYGDGIFEIDDGGDVNGKIIIQDNAVFTVNRDATALGYPPTGNWSPGGFIMTMEWGKASATIDQDGGTVNFDVPLEDGYGPGLIMSGRKGTPGYDVDTTYNLNGGTLNASAVFNVATANPPTGPIGSGGNGYSPIFNFNGGTLKASQSDSTDANVISQGFNHLMGNLLHAYVKAGGAKIDTNTFDASIDQALEHDPVLGGTLDGGLQKLGDGTLTLLQASTYTGDTTVNAGVLQVRHDFLDDASSVSVLSGAIMDLDFTGADTIAGLTLDGVSQTVGLYNGSTDGTYFTGTGSLLVIRGNLAWRTDAAGDWTSVNWTPDGGTSYIAPPGGEITAVNSGIVTVSTDLTVREPTISLAVAGGGTVQIAAAGTLAVTGRVNVGDGGTLGVSGELVLGGLNVDAGGTLALGAGAMVRSPAARAPANNVTITLDGTLRVDGGNAWVGDFFGPDPDSGGDQSFTNLTLTETARYEWSFTKSDAVDALWSDDGLFVVGTVNLADGLDIQLVDGGGSSAGIAGGVDVALFIALNGAVFDPSKITVEAPDGLDWTWDTLIDGEGREYPDLQFFENTLVLKGLVTGVVAPHAGDANDDKIVDADDLVLFDQQFGGTPGTTGVDNCDFDGDGDVDIDDFSILRDEWGWQLSGAPDAGPGASSATPEPATMSLLAIGGLVVLRRRRKASNQ